MCRCCRPCLGVLSLVITIFFFILLLLPFFFLLPSSSSISPRIKKSPPYLPLRFRYEGSFKIVQVADMHFGNGIVTRCRDVIPSEAAWCSDLNTAKFLIRMIRAEDPDLVVFTGDNIYGSGATDAAVSLFKAFRPVLESGIPWAAVLGNHDQKLTMTQEELMLFISLMDYSVSQVNPSTTERIDGFGNYYITVKGAFGSELANTSVLSMYFLDSGDHEIVNGFRTYGWIRESQFAWLQKTSQGLQVDICPLYYLVAFIISYDHYLQTLSGLIMLRE